MNTNGNKLITDVIEMEKDIDVICVTAKSFPDGVMEAHQKIHTLVPFYKDRKYFWISRPNENGEIIYKAAVEEWFDWEVQKLGLEKFTIKKWAYLCHTIKDFMKDIDSIGVAFREMIASPEIDPNWYCLEWYFNDNDVRCMVPLKPL